MNTKKKSPTSSSYSYSVFAVVVLLCAAATFVLSNCISPLLGSLGVNVCAVLHIVCVFLCLFCCFFICPFKQIL